MFCEYSPIGRLFFMNRARITTLSGCAISDEGNCTTFFARVVSARKLHPVVFGMRYSQRTASAVERLACKNILPSTSDVTFIVGVIVIGSGGTGAGDSMPSTSPICDV